MGPDLFQRGVGCSKCGQIIRRIRIVDSEYENAQNIIFEQVGGGDKFLGLLATPRACPGERHANKP